MIGMSIGAVNKYLKQEMGISPKKKKSGSQRYLNDGDELTLSSEPNRIL